MGDLCRSGVSCREMKSWFRGGEDAKLMNDGNQHGLPNFDHPTEALLRQLVNAATGRLSVPLRVVDFRPVGRSAASAGEAKVTLEVNGTTQPYTLVAN